MITRGDPDETLTEAIEDIMTPVEPEVESEVWQPKWIKPNMNLDTAAREANMRGYYLKARWDAVMGLTIVAVRRQT